MVSYLNLLFRVKIPEAAAGWLEVGVAVMLAILGLNLLRHVFRGERLHVHPHRHGERTHNPPHFHGHGHEGIETIHSRHAHSGSLLVDEKPVKSAASGGTEAMGVPSPNGFRTFLVGVVHGLAGSASLMLLVLATVPDRSTAFLYVVLFGIGSVGGMFLMSLIMSLPFLAASKSDRALRAFQAVAAVVTLVVSARMFFEHWGS